MLPSRQLQIRSVRLRWECKYPLIRSSPDEASSLPYDGETWDDVCRILAGLTGLQELSICLRGACTWRLAEMLLPLRQVKGVKSFDVTVPKFDRREHEMAYWPFRLIEK